ncbi:AraC family transcriptional regulator [Dictyobacter alpinus]|uniref:AraC family transcriptional regulator n=1 Tax=Dictyobacter alpinus TaxID=2014873 RepID=A0A402BCI7_9CHLR|nr:helix-turn-helix domain-containing protein [Dictyobacter alpinus]GCE29121.1 AraC family transcriptional regulator [Dictyobacter alpinus]
MLLHYIPAAPLANWVASFWLYEGAPAAHTLERRLPDGMIELIINLQTDKVQVADPCSPDQLRSYSGAVISGAHTATTLIVTSCMLNVIGVEFKPGGTLPFLGRPASEVRDQMVSLEDLWGGSARELYEQLLAAVSTQERFMVLERALLKRLDAVYYPHPSVIFALNQIQQAPVDTNISRIVEQLSISQKHFIQVFRDAIGLTPKQFCRLQRFQCLLEAIQPEPVDLNWAQLALDWGYFDQSHLIHDFQTFAGLAPGAYLAGRSQFHNHVPLLEQE